MGCYNAEGDGYIVLKVLFVKELDERIRYGIMCLLSFG